VESRRLTVFSFFNSILASVMVVCFAATLSRAIGVFETAWLTGMLSVQRGVMVFAFLVALEVQWSRRLLAPTAILEGEWLKRTIVEWTALLLALLALVWFQYGPRFSLRDLPALSAMTLQVISRREFFTGLFLMAMVWGLSRFLTFDLTALENVPASVQREAQRGILEEHNTARQRIWQDVFLMGGFMVFLSVFALPIVHFTLGMEMEFGSLGFEILVFFLCGLAVFVIGRLMLLRAEWVTERTGIDPGVSRQWIGYGLVFVAVLLMLAVALPTEYSFQLLSSLALVVSAVSMALTALWYTIIFTIIWILGLILPPAQEMEPLSIQLPGEGLPNNSGALPAGVSWVTVVRELLFWGIVLLVLVYAVQQILPLQRSVARRMRRWSWFRRLLDFVHRLRKRWNLWQRNFVQTVRESWQALREELAGRAGWEPSGFLNLRGLNPRQSIRFYFFALLRRGAERGIVRRPAQTPREYAAAFSEEESPIANELREMTLAFEEARYTKHPVGPDKARRVRKVWDTIRTYLRSPKRAGEAGGKR
jgi:hypothetical protein